MKIHNHVEAAAVSVLSELFVPAVAKKLAAQIAAQATAAIVGELTGEGAPSRSPRRAPATSTPAPTTRRRPRKKAPPTTPRIGADQVAKPDGARPRKRRGRGASALPAAAPAEIGASGGASVVPIVAAPRNEAHTTDAVVVPGNGVAPGAVVQMDQADPLGLGR